MLKYYKLLILTKNNFVKHFQLYKIKNLKLYHLCIYFDNLILNKNNNKIYNKNHNKNYNKNYSKKKYFKIF